MAGLAYDHSQLIKQLESQSRKWMTSSDYVDLVRTAIMEEIEPIYDATQDAELAEAVKAATIELLEIAEDMRRQNEMVIRVVHDCEAPRNKDSVTPVLELIDKATQLTTNARYNVEQDPKYQEVLGAFGLEAEAQPNQQEEDPDIVMESDERLAKNRTCPMTAKPLLELEEPVVDQMGYVYEKAAIYRYLKNNPQLQLDSPNAGTNYKISIGGLTRAHKVIRAQRLARISQPQQQSSDNVVDV